MARKIVKACAAVLGLVFLGGIVYLSLRPDPGPYIVALRSDTPEQVQKALDAVLTSDTVIIYDGRTFTPPTFQELQTLGQRYFEKASGQSDEPLKGDTAAWVGFANRVNSFLWTRPRPS